jgi:coenzyme PQQ biosynthesis protein PqqD
MSRPTDSSQPRLSAGCRWSQEESGDERTVLFPEGAIKVQGTGRRILERCDGHTTFLDIVDSLQKHYTSSDAVKIRDDVGKFLETLNQKRIVDY